MIQAVQALVVTQVRKHRLDGADALTVELPAAGGVDGMAHAFAGIAGIWRLGQEATDLPAAPRWVLSLTSTFEALLAQRAVAAVRRLGDVGLVGLAAGRDVDASSAAQHLARRAGGRVVIVEAEVLGPEVLGVPGLARGLLVVQRVGLGLVLVLVCEALVTLAHLVVGDQRGGVAVMQLLHIGIAVVARVGGDQGVGVAPGLGLLDHGRQHGLLRA